MRELYSTEIAALLMRMLRLVPEPLSLASSVMGIPQLIILLNLRTSIMGVMGTMGTELMKESTELHVSPPRDLNKRHKENTPTGGLFIMMDLLAC